MSSSAAAGRDGRHNQHSSASHMQAALPTCGEKPGGAPAAQCPAPAAAAPSLACCALPMQHQLNELCLLQQ